MKILLVTADRSMPGGDPQNIGDALLTDALAIALAGLGHQVDVADFGAGRRAVDRVHRSRLAGLPGLAARVRHADVVLLGGGSLLADDQPDRPFAGLPRLCLAVRAAALLHRRPFAVFGAGADPITRLRARLAVRLVLLGVPVWLRDPESVGHAGAQSRAQVSGDVSLFLAPEVRDLALPTRDRRGVVLALNRREASSLTVAQVRTLAEVASPVRFVSMDQGDDPDHAALAPEVVALLDVVPGPLSWDDAARLIGGAHLVVASRMHALYLAVMAGVPAVATGTAPKVRSFVATYGVGHAADLEAAVTTRGHSADPESEAVRARLHDALAALDARWAR